MSQSNLALASVIVALLLSGCSQYDAGNLDRQRCEDLRVGMTRSEVITHMGQPQSSRGPSPAHAEEILIYNRPSMPGLPMFAADKDVEVLLERGASGPVLKAALCSGTDG